MNAYGALASDLWRAADERRFLAIEQRETFFAEIGARVEHRVLELVPQLAGEAPVTEPSRLRDLRLRKAKKQAEEIAYQEIIFSQSVVEPELEYAS